MSKTMILNYYSVRDGIGTVWVV